MSAPTIRLSQALVNSNREWDTQQRQAHIWTLQLRHTARDHEHIKVTTRAKTPILSAQLIYNANHFSAWNDVHFVFKWHRAVGQPHIPAKFCAVNEEEDFGVATWNILPVSKYYFVWTDASDVESTIACTQLDTDFR